MNLSFFQLTLEKIIAAKLIGLPLLAVDYFYKNFLTNSLPANIAILIFSSYILSCMIVAFYQKKKHLIS